VVKSDKSPAPIRTLTHLASRAHALRKPSHAQYSFRREVVSVDGIVFSFVGKEEDSRSQPTPGMAWNRWEPDPRTGFRM